MSKLIRTLQSYSNKEYKIIGLKFYNHENENEFKQELEGIYVI
ncbi:hypothetical protein BHECKSOX2_855 [Bathymodiolus heckerae thiotrophic gill symbiont]|nr:hypothetical protein BHECKSOX2_855 [Bathymodiolus heckerae thiotrophic gill symbiont]